MFYLVVLGLPCQVFHIIHEVCASIDDFPQIEWADFKRFLDLGEISLIIVLQSLSLRH